MVELNPKLLKIREYLNVVISHWQRNKPKPPAHASFNDVRESMRIDTLEGYNELVWKLYEDSNFTEGDNLLKIIEEIEKEMEASVANTNEKKAPWK